MTEQAGTVGWIKHRAAVAALSDQLAAIPPGEPVRLAKRSSNLFRPREGTGRPGLDVSRLRSVIEVDPQQRVAQVQGMCTYEDLVDATLPHGLMPYVVPQLKTITLGGAVTGLGIESSSFRNGLPHESVRELDILTGDGEIVTASPTNDYADLFRTFPNSYGSLGYSVRLEIDLDPIKPFVHLRHLRFHDLADLVTQLGVVLSAREWEGEPVDFVDGVVFTAQESYLILGNWADQAPYTSDYTGRHIFYRSIQHYAEDYLTARDYLWRWDTDWFWCSRAFGVQNPTVRRLIPKRYLRSDVYGKIIRFENRHQWFARREQRRGERPRERVVQDVEIPLDRTEEFVRWFLGHVPIEPIWLCPLAVRDQSSGGKAAPQPGEQPWPLYPLQVGATYVNVGFWSAVEIPEGGQDGDTNRLIEAEVERLDGHKSLYSDAYYDEEDFWAHYGGAAYQQVKQAYDPAGRLPDLYAKAVGRR